MLLLKQKGVQKLLSIKLFCVTKITEAAGFYADLCENLGEKSFQGERKIVLTASSLLDKNQ
ncbi:MAG: hypothetical protein LPK21_13145 [Hymenobacteraceae bacterium]|nr:hypothetical protein [Hymenobacteraceae bacterium]MDX5513214.1 hypothetical protein [Hymenobacteraceae bacterium]